MNATLTERYVAAAMRSVPERHREDLTAELQASIADQIEARIETGEDAASAERAVLEALGDPDALAAAYTDRPQVLVGPRSYPEWLRLLKLLWAIVLPCVGVAVVIAQALSGATIGTIIGALVVTLLTTTVHIAFWTTLLFVILERAGTRIPRAPWTVDRLPEPRPEGAGLPDLIAALVALALLAGAVVWDATTGFIPGRPGLSFLDPALTPWWIAALFVDMAATAVISVVVYARRGWTIGSVVAKGVVTVALAAAALWLLSQGRLINPVFFPTLLGEGEQVTGVVTAIGAVAIVVIAVWDIVDVAIKLRKQPRIRAARAE